MSATTARLSDTSLGEAERQDLQRQREELEQELYRQLPALKPRLVEPDEVARTLPADGVLVEFQRFAPYDPSQPEEQRWGEPRYLALLHTSDGAITTEDLGRADDLDGQIKAALAATRQESPDSQQQWATLADRIFSPLKPHLSGQQQWFLSPDGELNRFPLTALPVLAAGQPWLPQGLQVRVLTSGRDLLPRQDEQRSPGQALVLANPSFVGWEPLSGTEAEGLWVAADLGVKLLQGPKASVKALEAARGPKVLHVASHGFFEETAPSGDPLLASGVVLAGADRSSLPSQRSAAESASRTSSEDDGYLTAKEAAQLQLDGTELVVLSACDTASGTIQTGEGVYGLQRALTAAGARSTLLSLWKVDDEATAYFMQRYYKLLKAGQGRRDLLVAVQEEFRTAPKLPGWSHPSYWAAWQLSGDVSPLPQ